MAMDRSDPRNTFSRCAHRYLVSKDHQSGPDLETIRQVASQQFPEVTVDVATGAGHALRAAGPYSGFTAALDLTLEMLRVARKHLTGAGLTNVRFIQSSADEMPLADRSVSLLTCRIAPHHFPSLKGFLMEVARVLAPEGQCVLVDSIVPGEAEFDRFLNGIERLRDPSHVRSHTLEQWLESFEAVGLEISSVQLLEREHSFLPWAGRTGLDEDGIAAVEKRFLDAPPEIRERFKVKLDGRGGMESYTDEKGIFLGRKGKGERLRDKGES